MMAYFTYGFCGLSAGLLVLALPETLGHTPPNSFEDIEDSTVDNQNEFIALKSSNHNKYQKVLFCNAIFVFKYNQFENIKRYSISLFFAVRVLEK